jgi:hypothetical protein
MMAQMISMCCLGFPRGLSLRRGVAVLEKVAPTVATDPSAGQEGKDKNIGFRGSTFQHHTNKESPKHQMNLSHTSTNTPFESQVYLK